MQPVEPVVQPIIIQQAPAANPNAKSLGTAYLLWLLVGILGVHQFYLGKPGRGVLYLLTLGGLGIGLIIDLFTLPAQVRRVNAGV